MHEFSLCKALIDQVEQEIRNSGHPGRVLDVEVIVGRLSGVHADSLRLAFDLLSPGTVTEGARMSVSQPAATCRCLECDARVEVDQLLVECPQCQSGQITVEGGRELLLQSIEIEE